MNASLMVKGEYRRNRPVYKFLAISILIFSVIIVTAFLWPKTDSGVVDVVIIGAGYAGLAAAKALRDDGRLSIAVLEATGRVGGRTLNLDVVSGTQGAAGNDHQDEGVGGHASGRRAGDGRRDAHRVGKAVTSRQVPLPIASRITVMP